MENVSSHPMTYIHKRQQRQPNHWLKLPV